MSSDAGQQGAGHQGGAFEALDPKLNIFALANGMDLVKEASSRRLGWYREGMERAILVELRDDGAFTVSAMSWKTRDPEGAHRAPQRDGMNGDDLVAGLSAILESALEAANCL